MNEENHKSLNAKLLHAYELIFALCEDQITPEQFRELDSLVCDDSEIRAFYVDVMGMRSSLRWFAFYLRPPLALSPAADETIVKEVGVDQLSNSLDESMITTALTGVESDEPDDFDEIFLPALAPAVNSRNSPVRPISSNFKRGVAAALLLVAGLVAYVASPRSHPHVAKEVNPSIVPSSPIAIVPAAPPVLVATLNFTQKSVWSATDSPPQDGKYFAGQTLKLQSGAAQLSLQHGGRLVVEGPAEVEFTEQGRIALHQGKIAATVPGGGFVVDCPLGSVTDLGTKFGVQVNSDGAAEVAVFQGRVSASLHSTASTQGSKFMPLTQGQAIVMSSNALSIDERGSMPQQFICSLVNSDVQSLDVIDLICGGDGTTHRRGMGINPTNGAIGKIVASSAGDSDGQYHRVTGYPFVDGVFIADVNRDAMTIDSVGDRFHFSGVGNWTSTYILTGGKFPSFLSPEISTVLDNVDYSTADHGIVLIHPNSGLTLDLGAVRRIYPDRALNTFRCRVGISKTINLKDPRTPNAAALVLIDGAMRFQNPHFSISDASFVIDIPLNQKDRFLTLVSTYAAKGSYNRVLWVDAKLGLSSGH